jgi:tricorn protease
VYDLVELTFIFIFVYPKNTLFKFHNVQAETIAINLKSINMSKSPFFDTLLLYLIDRAISICSRNPIISPSINHDKISFVYAGDIWVAGKDGSNVQRITAFDGVESNRISLQMD